MSTASYCKMTVNENPASELRLRPCARTACEARRKKSSTGSCCDEKCIEAIANASDVGRQTRSASSAGAFRSLRQWKAALERAECLCKAMLEMGLPSCCEPENSAPSTSKDQSSLGPDKCCSSGECKTVEPLSSKTIVVPKAAMAVAPNPKNCCSTTGCQSLEYQVPEVLGSQPCTGVKPGLQDCYSSTNPSDQDNVSTSNSKSPKPSCCTSSEIKLETASARKSCCAGSKLETSQQCMSSDQCDTQSGAACTGTNGLRSAFVDLEKAPVGEHATIQVSGMTCTGCERKLKNVLSSVAGIHNIKTSLVLARADFDLDAGMSPEEVVSLLERQTEFHCTVYHAGHQLEVLLPDPATVPASGHGALVLDFPYGLKSHDYPRGIESVQILDSKGREQRTDTTNRNLKRRLEFWIGLNSSKQHTARISYNPGLVGARDVLEKSFGTPLSLATLGPDREVGTETKHLRDTFYMTLLSALLTIPVLVMAWAPLPEHPIIYGSTSLALATLVQVLIAGPFYPKALKALLFSGMIEMDLLIVISTTTAYIYSVVAFAYEVKGESLSTGEFFETSTLLVTLIMFGRLASAYARQKAAKSISIQKLQPSTALLIEEGKEWPIDSRLLQYNDVFRVLPESIVPTDGIIVSGETELDESMITGEPIPVPKSVGSQIIAGSINVPTPILVRLTKLPVDNTISRIASMVDDAKLLKPKVQETADRVASYFVPCILALTIVVFSIWIAVGFLVRGTSTSTTMVTAITYALAALIVSCPCAIGLAVPMVMVIAGGVGARHGVIFQTPAAIENARKATHVVFDKTGTLTEGKFVVLEAIYREEDPIRAASLAIKLAASSKHPVSKALVKHLESVKTGSVVVENISSVIGKGFEATFEGQQVRGGSPSHTDAVEDIDVQRLLSQGLTVFCLRVGEEILAIYGLRDSVRTDAKAVISELQSRSVQVSIISGDSSAAVDKLAEELGVPLRYAKGQCSPEDKARYISSLSAVASGGNRRSQTTTTIFCGDGSNDAIALAKADIGINMADGTDMAKSAADVVLTRPSLAGVLVLVDLSRASMRRVYLNFAWSFIYNTFAILLAAGAFVNARIPPTYAGLGELVSVLPVVAIAIQLRWARFEPTKKDMASA